MRRAESGRFGLAAHGGAGVIRPLKRSLKAMEQALEEGYELLEAGASALDAVERTIVMLEDHPDFNAGKGSRLQLDGIIRMDASIMEGDALKAGAVAGIEDVANPIRSARAVMEMTDHVLLVGEKAKRFALSQGLGEGDVYTKRRLESWRKSLRTDHRHKRMCRDIFEGETVGAVALDRSGSVVSGSSTGGGTHMLPGRVGDTPVIGAGIYADSKCGAVSATGPGEHIVRTVLSKAVVDLMAAGMTPNRALKTGAQRLYRATGGYVGAVAVDPEGRIGIWHTTPHMYYSYRVSGRRTVTGASVG
jgi:beta-aspartyl-peptidase (threonine type)